MYNALLNLDLSSHSEVIALADYLEIMTKGNNPAEAEVFVNSDLAKIENGQLKTKCYSMKPNQR
jgi:hypothetical protein